MLFTLYDIYFQGHMRAAFGVFLSFVVFFLLSSRGHGDPGSCWGGVLFKVPAPAPQHLIISSTKW